jgi:hypothetical protein
VQVTVGAPHSSVATAVVYVTVALQLPGAAFTITSAGVLRLGGVLSCSSMPQTGHTGYAKHGHPGSSSCCLTDQSVFLLRHKQSL